MKIYLRKREPVPEMSVEKAAAWWFARLRSDPSSAELERFETWRKTSPQNAAAFDRLQELWDNLGSAAALPDIRAMRSAALSVTPSRPRYQSMAAATVIAVSIVCGTYLATSGHLNQLVRFADSDRSGTAAMDRDVFSTAVGERASIPLKDGSVMTLDTNSVARVAYSAKERTIVLVRGQAIFDVAKHKSIPFVVHAGDRQIAATGTSFNVRLNPASIEVTLIEGHVVVAQSMSRAVNTPLKRTELQPGERLLAKPDAPDIVSVADVIHTIGWQSGKLFFTNEALGDAADEVNRYAETHVVLKDDKLRNLRISGVFRTGQPTEFARALAEIFPVEIQRDGAGNIVITLKNRT